MPTQEYAGCVVQDIFHVVSDPTRRQLVELLSEADELSVSDLVASVEASQPTVSKHLKVLRDAGVVQTRADGQRRLYSLVPDSLAGALEWLTSVHDAAAGTGADATESGEAEGADESAESIERSGVAESAELEVADAESRAAGEAESVADDAAHRIVQNVGRQIESVTEKAQTFFQRFGRRK